MEESSIEESSIEESSMEESEMEESEMVARIEVRGRVVSLTRASGRLGILVGVLLGLGAMVAKAAPEPNSWTEDESSSPTASSTPGVPPEAKVLIEQAIFLVETLGPEVWPDFAVDRPTLLLISGEVEFLFGRRVPPEGFVEVGDELLEAPVFFRPRVYGKQLRACFPALGDGKDVVVVGTGSQVGLSPAEWTLMVAHELFHVFQGEHGLNEKVMALRIGSPTDGGWHLNYPFPYGDPPVSRAMLLLGDRLFQLGAQEGQSTLADEAKMARVALANLVDILEMRSREDEKNLSYLRYQTTKEGVARYFECRLAELAGKRSDVSLPGFSALAGRRAYAAAWRSTYRTKRYLIKHAGTVSRDRVEFYGLGHGLALALDRVSPDWKQNYFDGVPWVDELFFAAQ